MYNHVQLQVSLDVHSVLVRQQLQCHLRTCFVVRLTSLVSLMRKEFQLMMHRDSQLLIVRKRNYESNGKYKKKDTYQESDQRMLVMMLPNL